VTVLANSFEGGGDGTTLTTGNTGGASGNAFDLVNASGGREFDTGITINDAVSALLTGGVTESPFLRWDSTSWPGASEVWFRMYFRASDPTPATNMVIAAFKEANGSTTGCDVRLTTEGRIQLRAPFTERYLSTYAMSANTPVRLEVHVVSSATVGRIEARLFYGANLNGATPDESFGSASTNWDTGDGTVAAVNFGCCTSPGQAGYTITIDGVALSDEGWIGPEDYEPPTPGSGDISYIGAGAGVTGTGDITPTYPIGYTAVAGDVAVIHLDVTVADTGEYTTPAGWTKVGTVLNEIGAIDGRHTVYLKKLTTAEALPTITGDTVDQFVAFCEIYRGVHPDTQLDVAAVTSQDNNTTTFAPTGITTVTGGAWAVSSIGIPFNGGDADLATAQGFELGAVEATTTGSNVTAGAAHRLVDSPGPVTFPTWEKTEFTGIGQWCAVSFALRPAEASTPPTAGGEQYWGVFAGTNAPNIGGPVDPPPGGVSSLLVPDTGAWFGATTPAFNQSGTSAQGLEEWEAITGFRPHVFPWYKTGAWNGIPTAAERAIIDPGGGVRYAIPKYAWKVGAGSNIGTWIDVANGVYDTQIDACADGLKTYPFTMFFSVFHEPEDNVNTSGNTRAAYRAMWRRVRDRFEARGVDNLVYVLQFAGAPNHAVNAAGSGFEDMYPGDDYIDWLGMDPYTHSPTRNTLDELVNATAGGPSGYGGWYTWAQTNHPTKPIMLGEFGAGNVGCQGASTLGVQFTDAQGEAVVNQWIADLGVTNTAIKAFLYWNGRALGKYDYQLQRDCRKTLYGGAITAMCNDSYFDNDPNLARF